jgi:ATP-dependent DNA helicase RecG
VHYEALTARQFCDILELSNVSVIPAWLGRLQDWKVIRQVGRTSGTRYFVDPEILRKLEFPTHTTLARIEPYRIRELVLEDLQRHPNSGFGEIHERIGSEIPDYLMRRQINELIKNKKVRFKGNTRARRYRLFDNRTF